MYRSVRAEFTGSPPRRAGCSTYCTPTRAFRRLPCLPYRIDNSQKGQTLQSAKILERWIAFNLQFLVKFDAHLTGRRRLYDAPWVILLRSRPTARQGRDVGGWRSHELFFPVPLSAAGAALIAGVSRPAPTRHPMCQPTRLVDARRCLRSSKGTECSHGELIGRAARGGRIHYGGYRAKKSC